MKRILLLGYVCPVAVLTIAIVFAPESVEAQSLRQEAVSAVGFQKGRSYFSPEPFEHYDTVSGNVLLTFTDLSLPGNGGRSLTFQRTYNNLRDVEGQKSRWTFGLAGMVMRVIEKPVPPNYNFDDNASLIMDTTPEFEMADGAIRKTMYVTRPNPATAATMEVRSADFYLYDRQYHFLKMPNGLVCYYDPETGRLTSVHDQYGAVADLVWSAESVVVTQHLGNGQARQVTLTLDADSRVTAMQFGGSTWTYVYGYEQNDVRDITSVTLPPPRPRVDIQLRH